MSNLTFSKMNMFRLTKRKELYDRRDENSIRSIFEDLCMKRFMAARRASLGDLDYKIILDIAEEKGIYLEDLKEEYKTWEEDYIQNDLEKYDKEYAEKLKKRIQNKLRL